MPAIYNGERIVKKSELVPCPFCGQNDLCMYSNGEPIESKDRAHYIHCCSCDSNGPSDYTFKGAVDKWQARRADTKEENQNSAPLEELLRWCEQKMIDCRAIADPDDALSCELAECGFHDFMSMRDEVALKLHAACPAEKLTAKVINAEPYCVKAETVSVGGVSRNPAFVTRSCPVQHCLRFANR